MAVYENHFKFSQNFLVKARLIFFTDNHCKTVYGQVWIEYSSSSVLNYKVQTWISSVEPKDGVASIRNCNCIFLHCFVPFPRDLSPLIHCYYFFTSYSSSVNLNSEWLFQMSIWVKILCLSQHESKKSLNIKISVEFLWHTLSIATTLNEWPWRWNAWFPSNIFPLSIRMSSTTSLSFTLQKKKIHRWFDMSKAHPVCLDSIQARNISGS